MGSVCSCVGAWGAGSPPAAGGLLGIVCNGMGAGAGLFGAGLFGAGLFGAGLFGTGLLGAGLLGAGLSGTGLLLPKYIVNAEDCSGVKLLGL